MTTLSLVVNINIYKNKSERDYATCAPTLFSNFKKMQPQRKKFNVKNPYAHTDYFYLTTYFGILFEKKNEYSLGS